LVTRLQALNGVSEPRWLQPGTRLRIPLEWTRRDATTVQLIALRGEVQVADAQGNARSVQPHAAMQAGETITTSQDGYALLQFQDGTRLALLADSVLRVLTSQVYAYGMSEARLELLRGRTENRVPRMTHGVRMEIQTPAGVTSVRGTDYRVSSDEGERARVEVLEGEVAVDATSTGVVVPAGFGTLMQAGQAPSAPARLLPSPDLSQLPAAVTGLPVVLELTPLAGAQAYRVQLARDDVFESVVLELLEPEPQVHLPLLPSGSYVVRVRGIDDVGLEGMHVQHTLDIDATPAAPLPQAPTDAQAIVSDEIALRWQVSDDAALVYRVQVARDGEFGDLVIDETGITAEALVLDSGLAAGMYYWRVAAHHPEYGDSPFGPVRSFRRVPRVPVLSTPRLTPEDIRLSWESAETGVRHRVQLARDETFADPLQDSVVDGAEIALPRPSPGAYFLGVRAIGQDGYEGPEQAAVGIEVPPPPTPPSLIDPPEAAVVDTFPLILRWQARAGERYRVQLNRDDASQVEVFDHDALAGSEARVEQRLAPGRYAWRVAASTASDGSGEFSAPRRLHVPPGQPLLAAPSVTRTQVQLDWHSEEPVAAYQVQLARDADFADLVTDQRVTGTQLTLPRLAAGDYFARVQAVDADGIAGTFSQAQALHVPRPFPWWVLPVLPLLLLLL
ncbi:MAG: FecR domain-containing protein, partial [Burkholderiales bacterium]|nr:FecR domain-containing protein [Burkholderiales bacterium]